MAGIAWLALTISPGTSERSVAANPTASEPERATVLVYVPVTVTPTELPMPTPRRTAQPYRSPVPTLTPIPVWMSGSTDGWSDVGDRLWE
jgi:hypothetical protein